LALDAYLRLPGVRPVTKTIRAPEPVWDRLEALASRKAAELSRRISLNALVVALMVRACDDEGIE
jgi:hypothetical protein